MHTDITKTTDQFSRSSQTTLKLKGLYNERFSGQKITDFDA